MTAAVYIDLDDVLCETARELMHIAAQEFGRNVAFEEIPSFDIGLSFDLTPEQVEQTMQLIHAPDRLLAIVPTAGAREVLTEWTRAGLRIEIVTGRPPATRESSAAWLANHAIPYHDLIFVDKYARGHRPHGGAACLSLAELRTREYRLAIDDSPEMATFLAREMQTQVILFDRPWNAGLTGPSGAHIERCRDWQEIRTAAASVHRTSPIR